MVMKEQSTILLCFRGRLGTHKMKTNPEPTSTSTFVMKATANTTYTVRVLGTTETRISQLNQ